MLTLTDTDFAGLEKLELLMLHSNEINAIPDKVFRDLRSLQVRKNVRDNPALATITTFKQSDSNTSLWEQPSCLQPFGFLFLIVSMGKVRTPNRHHAHGKCLSFPGGHAGTV